MIRILHLRSSCGLYGADRALLELASATTEPFEPVIGTLVRPDAEDALGDEAHRRGLPTLKIWSRGRADLASARWLADQARREGISLLHAHDYKSLTLGALVMGRTQLPLVATFHGDTAASLPLRAYEAWARLLGNLAHAVAAVSAPLTRRLRRWILTAPVHHVPNGIRVSNPCSADERARARRELGIPADRQVVSVVGRLSPEKGHGVLIHALERLPRRPLLLVAGDGVLRDPLQAQAIRLDVRWLGFVSDARQVYAASDLVVLPSFTEGLPLVALEAMAAGTPLVASAVGELPTLLAGEAGLLVTPGDDAALTCALGRALEDEALRREMAARALERVRRDYTVEAMAEGYMRRLYAPVAQRRPRSESTRAATAG